MFKKYGVIQILHDIKGGGYPFWNVSHYITGTHPLRKKKNHAIFEHQINQCMGYIDNF